MGDSPSGIPVRACLLSGSLNRGMGEKNERKKGRTEEKGGTAMFCAPQSSVVSRGFSVEKYWKKGRWRNSMTTFRAHRSIRTVCL